MRNILRKILMAGVALAASGTMLAAVPTPASAATTTVCGNTAANNAIATGRYVVVALYSDRATCAGTSNYATFRLQTIDPAKNRLTVCGGPNDLFIPTAWLTIRTYGSNVVPCQLGSATFVIERISLVGSKLICGNTSADRAVNSGKYFTTELLGNQAQCGATSNYATFRIVPKYSTDTVKRNVCVTSAGRWVPAGWVISRTYGTNVFPCMLNSVMADIIKL